MTIINVRRNTDPASQHGSAVINDYDNDATLGIAFTSVSAGTDVGISKATGGSNAIVAGETISIVDFSDGANHIAAGTSAGIIKAKGGENSLASGQEIGIAEFTGGTNHVSTGGDTSIAKLGGGSNGLATAGGLGILDATDGSNRFAVPRPFASRTKSNTTVRTPSVFFATGARTAR